MLAAYADRFAPLMTHKTPLVFPLAERVADDHRQLSLPIEPPE